MLEDFKSKRGSRGSDNHNLESAMAIHGMGKKSKTEQQKSISMKLRLVGNSFQLVRSERGPTISSDGHLFIESIRVKIAAVKSKWVNQQKEFNTHS